AVGPGGGGPAVEADAARDFADDRPADPPRLVRHREVLWRDAGAVGDRHRLLQRACPLELVDRKAHRLRKVGGPGERARASEMVLADHRPPDRLPHLAEAVLPALDPD